MKTETKIAEENIKKWISWDSPHTTFICETHKVSCQRFLEFLENWNNNVIVCEECNKRNIDKQLEMKQKITDLKNAIKKYDEAGI